MTVSLETVTNVVCDSWNRVYQIRDEHGREDSFMTPNLVSDYKIRINSVSGYLLTRPREVMTTSKVVSYIGERAYGFEPGLLLLCE